MLWVAWCPPRSIVHVLTPRTSDWDLPYRGHQVTIGSLGWVLIQYDWCPYKEGKRTQAHTEERGGRETQGEGRPEPASPARNDPADNLTLDLQPPDLRHFC